MIAAGFNLPDGFSWREFNRVWSPDYCVDCESEPCRCDSLYEEDEDVEFDKDEVKETFE